MITSFGCSETEKLFHTGRSKKFATFARVAQRKLVMLHAAANIRDLLSPPNNKLEALKHSREGQHSIRIIDKYRICFRWNNGNVLDVAITDYHSG
jgi:proteic killer suppression protein